jgi:menaquinone-dependent protoporphyrinogen oxidase
MRIATHKTGKEEVMDKKVLATYASKYGATAEIAGRIDYVLTESRLQVEVVPAKQVKDLAPYNVIILGSAVYYSRWQKDAIKFLKKHKQILAKKQVWLFSSGPSGEGDPVELLNGWEFPSLQQKFADQIQPRGITVFHGDVNVERLNNFERKILANLDAPVGDFRDCEAITAWARSIA